MATKFRIGDKVRLSFGNRIVTGTVVEDRGRIGVGGRQLFRIVVKMGDGERALELPAEKLRALDPLKMDIEEIVQILNDESDRFEFGKLQEIRKENRSLRKKPCRTPFGRRATFSEGYAYHVGGRDELQFNVGFECDEDILRWGVAVSLQASRSIPNPVEILSPKLDKLNEFIRVHKDDHLSGFLMWHWHEDSRSSAHSPEVIPRRLYTNGVFIFLGKYGQLDNFDADTILRDFDMLLPLYKYVESESSDFPILDDESGSTFRPKHQPDRSKRRYRTEATRVTGQNKVNRRYSQIQDVLEQELRSELGSQVVREHRDGVGGRVDLIAQRRDDLEFYEIKLGGSARSCIRQALGQLIEYGFWPGAPRPAKLFVVGEPSLDRDAEEYLQILREDFRIPIYYRQVVVGN